jgi:hypothetical protein
MNFVSQIFPPWRITTVKIHYQETTSENWEDFVYAIVTVIFGVYIRQWDCCSYYVKIHCQETASGDCNRLRTLVCVWQWSIKCSHKSWVNKLSINPISSVKAHRQTHENIKSVHCLFTHCQCLPNVYHHQIVVSITVCSPEQSDIKYAWMLSPVYQNMVNLIVSLSISRCPNKFMSVTMWEHCTFDNQIF